MAKYNISFNGTWAGSEWSLANVTYYNDADEVVTDTALATKYELKEGVTVIGKLIEEGSDSAFGYSTQLTSIEIPSEVTGIGAGSFYDCTSLINVKFNEGLEVIEDTAFWGCPIESLELPKSLHTLGVQITESSMPVFLRSKFPTLDLHGPMNVHAFPISDSDALTTVTIREGVVFNTFLPYNLPNFKRINLLGSNFQFVGGEEVNVLTELLLTPAITEIPAESFIGLPNLTTIYASPAESVETVRAVVATNNPDQAPLVTAVPEEKMDTIFLTDGEGNQILPITHSDAVFLDEFTEAEINKTLTEKLTELESAVVPQVQSNWEQTDSTAIDFIKGKPDIQSLSDSILDNTNSIQTEAELREAADTALELRVDEAFDLLAGSKTYYSEEYSPTLENEPAVSWTTDTIKDSHIGELFFNIKEGDADEGKAWRFVKRNSVYEWYQLKDSDAVLALSAAIQAQTTADSKNTIHLTQPTKYSKGDLWKLNAPYTLNENYYVIGTILIASSNSDSFISSHWSVFSQITVGGVNLVNNSSKLLDNTLATNLINVYPNTIYFEQGKPYTISIEYNTLDSTNVVFSVRFSDIEETSIMYVRVSGESYITNNQKSRFSKTIIWAYESQEVIISSYLYDNSVNPIVAYPVIQYNIQIENGNIPTDYTPAQGTALMEVEYEDGTTEAINIVTAI